MSRVRSMRPRLTPVALALACGLALCSIAHAGEPSVVKGPLWDTPAPKQLSDDIEKGRNTILESENFGRGVKAGLAKAGNVKDLGKAALDFSKALNATDERLSPNFEPAGAPDVPSKCMENKACRPCFTDAYAKINKTRAALEKVRAHYDYTHRFTTSGLALMNGVAATAGGPAAIGAAVETNKINGALSDFDGVVRRKNAELLARLQDELKGVNACEAKFYKNDDWYDRFGYMYYQFMAAHYGYANG